MKRMLSVLLLAGAIAVGACDDRPGAGRPLGLAAAGDSSVDSTPGQQPGRVASVTVSPPSDTVAVGDSAGFFADLRDANGIAISDGKVKWSVADPGLARIEAAFGQSVILRAVRRGATTVTARSHGQTGSAQLVVVDSLPPPPPPDDSVATVTVTPSADTVAAGDSASFFADLRDAQGNALSGRAVSWTVSDSSVARIEGAFGQTVIIRAERAGSALVTATSEGKSGSAHLVVTDSAPPPPPPGDSVAAVTVTPSADTVAAGDTARFFADLRDTQGNPLSGRAVSWTVSDSSVARIEGAFGQTVIIRAERAGSALVTATSEGKSGSGRVIVP
jgi:uncharacterized protein YjdB